MKGAKLGAFALAVMLTSSPSIAWGQSYDDGFDYGGSDVILILLLIAVVWLAYFIPTIVAFRRKHPNRWAILALNTVFGATGLGWIGTLVWACGVVHLSPTGSNGGESGLNLFVNDPTTVKFADVPRPASQEAELTERLQRLKRLFDSGALDAGEYASMRKPIMDQLLK